MVKNVIDRRRDHNDAAAELEEGEGDAEESFAVEAACSVCRELVADYFELGKSYVVQPEC